MVTETSAPALLTAKELSAEIHLSVSAIYDLAAHGKLPHYRVGGSVRFALDEVLEATRKEVAS
jgi:excisionase family DNA binding protein